LVVFAVPNVVGAAMMVTLLPSAYAACSLCDHRPALAASPRHLVFCFHLFFFLSRRMLGRVYRSMAHGSFWLSSPCTQQRHAPRRDPTI
jgi:hypothetical protein